LTLLQPPPLLSDELQLISLDEDVVDDDFWLLGGVSHKGEGRTTPLMEAAAALAKLAAAGMSM
jgi:hypothetical protein